MNFTTDIKEGTYKDVKRAGYSEDVAIRLGAIDQIFEDLIALNVIDGDDVEKIGVQVAICMRNFK